MYTDGWAYFEQRTGLLMYFLAKNAPYAYATGDDYLHLNGKLWHNMEKENDRWQAQILEDRFAKSPTVRTARIDESGVGDFELHRYLLFVLRNGEYKGWGNFIEKGMCGYYDDNDTVMFGMGNGMSDKWCYYDLFEWFEEGVEYYFKSVASSYDKFDAFDMEIKDAKGNPLYLEKQPINDNMKCMFVVEDCTGVLRVAPIECFIPGKWNQDKSRF